jgi:molybdopterin-guanine dinucleotide biosynthesis protein A
MNFAGFILIGGKSSRMGEDKFALRLNGQTFLETAFETIRRAKIEQISVVVSEQTNFAGNFPVVKDIYQNRGALSGIHSALFHSEALFTVISACDYPFVSTALIEFLTYTAEIESDFDAFAPVQADGRIQPLCAVYKTAVCRQKLSEMLADEGENYSARDFLNRLKTRYIKFAEIKHLPHAENFFFNINTPENLAEATKISENHYQ